MKKIIAMVLVIVMMAAVLTGCGGNKELNVGVCQLMVHDSLDQAHRTGKGQFLFQSQRKAMLKNAQTTAQLHSSHMLVK